MSEARFGGLRIAFLDDDAAIRLAMVRTCAAFGVRVAPVTTLAELRAELAWFDLDLAILDYHLEGSTLTRDVAFELCARVPLVIWTGDTESAEAVLGGAAPILSKSSGVDRLFETVARLVRSPR